MKRAIVLLSVIGLFAIGGIAFATPVATPQNRDTGADENRSIAVRVTSGTYRSSVEGEACGFNTQVLVTDAGGDIIGTVDLVDISTIYLPEPVYPGSITDGACVVEQTIDVDDSGFYTFIIRDFYEWTVSAEDLDQRDWTMTIELPR